LKSLKKQFLEQGVYTIEKSESFLFIISSARYYILFRNRNFRCDGEFYWGPSKHPIISTHYGVRFFKKEKNKGERDCLKQSLSV
jgi:hypothetical protein